jgi:hypothetical protein
MSKNLADILVANLKKGRSLETTTRQRCIQCLSFFRAFVVNYVVLLFGIGRRPVASS